MNVTVEQAYEQACLALGEALVRERFQADEIRRLAAEVEALRLANTGGPLAEPTSGRDNR